MRQLLLLLALFTSILACTSCRKEPPVGPTATVNVSIKTVYGDKPFIAGEEYDYPSGGSIRFDKLAIFLSDISLVTENGTDEIALDDIVYLDITSLQYDANSAEKGWMQSYFKVPVGDYTGVKFGLGVAHEENNQSPEDFASSNPLGILDRYSHQYYSYVFEDIAGHYYQSNDTTAFNIKIVDDEMFRQVELAKGFSIVESGNNIEITFDLKKVFQFNDSILDLAKYPMVVSPALPQMEWLSKSVANSFSL